MKYFKKIKINATLTQNQSSKKEMSSIRNNNVRSVSNPFCKVCKDAGKSENEYTSHWVKTNDKLTGKSITTCPTLLSQECRYCHNLGHTTKYCQELVNKYDEKKIKKQPIVKEQNKTETEKKVRFDVLAYDSDEDEKMTSTPASDGPVPVTTTTNPVLTGWAAIVAKPVPEPGRPIREKTPLISEGMKMASGWVPPTMIQKPVLTRSEVLGISLPVRRKPGKSWADDDSDEEVEMEVIPFKPFKLIDEDPTW